MMRLLKPAGETEEHIALFSKLKLVFLLSALVCASGCGLADTKRQNQDIQAENRRVYEIYQEHMRSLNEQRQMSGIPPKPVKPYEDWQQSPGTD
jgi:hypothetical protein